MCADPSQLSLVPYFYCYLTTAKHVAFYWSFLTVFALLALVVPLLLLLGLLAALAKRSTYAVLRWFGQGYIAMVRGVPDIIFFLFIPIAVDQFLEVVRHKLFCPDAKGAIYQGSDFVVCAAAKLPLSTSPQVWHDVYGFLLAVAAFAVVFGAFAGNVLDGALKAVPTSQLETARAYGFTRRQTLFKVHLPQMWRYALPGLFNIWLVLTKATPLLFLLGVEDMVYWARELGSSKTPMQTAFPHGDWRIWYFGFLLIFFLALTALSESLFKKLMKRFNPVQVAGNPARVAL